MNLIKITDLTRQFGLSSRTLRYYEQMGLITSVRLPFESYRYYDDSSVQRLQQIMILRKMQIPIKEILRIYESPEISTLVEVFTRKIAEIEREVTALSELKHIIDTFLREMTDKGIRKISALPLLYEEMEKQLALGEKEKASPAIYDELSKLHAQLAKPLDPAILFLPSMRVLSSCPKDKPQTSDLIGFWHMAQTLKLPAGLPGQHEQFEFQTGSETAVMLRIDDDFQNETGYLDFSFSGGLYAAVSVYVDEDLGEQFRRLVKSFDENPFYEIDYTHEGKLCRPALVENLISPDEKRELVSLFAPVKKRLANPSLFGKPVELLPDVTSIAEIEAQNPVLWKVDVPLDSLTPINNPHYRILENGELEYTGWISTRVLDTNVAVKLPFRVDLEFRLDENDERFGYGADEGCILFYHGEDSDCYSGGVSVGNLSQNGFGINMGNQPSEDLTKGLLHREAITFHQPIFHDIYDFPGRGGIHATGYNQVTWIIGMRHLAVIINGELRYCGTDFPYMSLEPGLVSPQNIVIGSNGQGMKYFRSIRISQLAHTPKTRLKKEELVMITKQSNNLIPNIHRLVTDEAGENYWFNGCARYVMECLGETDYDYNFFAGLTGDVFTQYYPKGRFRGDGVSAYMLVEGPHMCLRETDNCFTLVPGESGFIEQLFEKCGYASTFVPLRELRKNTDMYLQTLLSYIDKGVPVIVWGTGEPPLGVLVGYEEFGKTLLFLTGNNNHPERLSLESILEEGECENAGWIFLGNKKEERPLKQLYREAIRILPKLLSTDTPNFCFGSGAFRAWAADIEQGRFVSVSPEEFDPWTAHTAYVCALATNASCCHAFLEKAMQLNPDLDFLREVSRLYRRCGEMWNNDNGTDLEALGGGFNVTLEALQDQRRRGRIAAKLRDFADVTDEIVRVLRDGLKEQFAF